MKRKKHKSRYPLPEKLVLAIEAIEDPTKRAIAACQAKMIGDAERTRAILASCVAEADAFYAAAAAVQLAIRALPLGKPRVVARRKPYSPPFRMPSLLDEDTSSACKPATEDSTALVEVVSAADLVSDLAAATLEVSTEGDDVFADLVASPGFHEFVAHLKANPPPGSVELPELNLFRDFEIDIGQSPNDANEIDIDVPAPSSGLRCRRKRGPRPVAANLFAAEADND